MDEELLHAKGVKPESAEHAAVDGFALRIGQRAGVRVDEFPRPRHDGAARQQGCRGRAS